LPPSTNKQNARRFFEECWEKSDLELVGELATSDISMYHFPAYPEGLHGLEQIREHITGVRGLFPDLHIQINDLIAEDDKVAAYFTLSGTQKGSWMGLPPTNNHVIWRGVYIYRFERDKIAEITIVEDGLTLLHQIKALNTWNPER